MPPTTTLAPAGAQPQVTCPAAPDNVASVRATRAEALTAIIRKTKLNVGDADRLLSWFEELLAEARMNGYAVHYLTDYERDTFHRPMSILMPDKTVAVPGSHRATVERYLCDPTKGEFGLMHDMSEDGRRYCTLRVRWSVVHR